MAPTRTTKTAAPRKPRAPRNSTSPDVGFTCRFCSDLVTFTREYDLKRHVNGRHKSEGYGCTECSHWTPQKSNMRRHMRDIHSVRDKDPVPMERAPSTDVGTVSEAAPSYVPAPIPIHDVAPSPPYLPTASLAPLPWLPTTLDDSLVSALEQSIPYTPEAHNALALCLDGDACTASHHTSTLDTSSDIATTFCDAASTFTGQSTPDATLTSDFSSNSLEPSTPGTSYYSTAVTSTSASSLPNVGFDEWLYSFISSQPQDAYELPSLDSNQLHLPLNFTGLADPLWSLAYPTFVLPDISFDCLGTSLYC